MSEERRRPDRLEVFGELAEIIVHQLKNPLAAIKAHAQLGKLLEARNENTADLEKVLGRIEVSVDELAQTLDEFLLWAKPAHLAVTRCDLGRMLTDILGLMELDANRVGARMRVHSPRSAAEVHADERLLKQALLNVMRNAIEAASLVGRGASGGSELGADTGPIVTVKVRRFQRPASICIAVHNTGPEIPKPVRGRIFDPFFTTKSGARGLGLAVAQGIIEQAHGGKIWFRTGKSHGTTFYILLPLNPRLL